MLRNLIKTLWGLEERSVPLTSKQIFDIFPNGTSTSSGTRINKDSIFGLPAWFRGVNLISTTLARIPCHIYEREANGGRRRAIEHPAYRLLTKQSNPFLTAFAFKRQLVCNALWSGNGYAWIQRDNFADPQGLYVLDSQATYPMVVYGLNPVPEVYYVTTINNQNITISAEDIIHLKGLGNHDGLCGMSLTETVKESLGLGLAVIKYGAVYFRNGGGTGATVIELPGNLKGKEAIEQFRASVEGIHNGLDNAHRIALLQGGAKLNRTPISNEEAQFLQSREMSAVDIANILGLPAHKLNAKISTSYSSIEAENLALLSDTYDGLMVNLEQELESKLLKEAEKEADSHFIEFMRDALTRADSKTEIDSLISQLNNGLLSWEEVRQIRNLPTEKDITAQQWRLPSNITIEGDAAPPAPPGVEAAQDQPQAEAAEEPAPEAPEADEEARSQLHKLTLATLHRLKNRLVQDQPSKADLIKRHKTVFYDALPGAEVWVDDLFENLGHELDSVLPEQRKAVYERINVETLAGELWN